MDFYVPAAALVIELDGGIHQDRTAADSERDEVLRIIGLEVVRIPNEEVEASLGGVVERLRATVRARLALRPEEMADTGQVEPAPLPDQTRDADQQARAPLSSSAEEGKGEGS